MEDPHQQEPMKTQETQTTPVVAPAVQAIQKTTIQDDTESRDKNEDVKNDS